MFSVHHDSFARHAGLYSEDIFMVDLSTELV